MQWRSCLILFHFASLRFPIVPVPDGTFQGFRVSSSPVRIATFAPMFVARLRWRRKILPASARLARYRATAIDSPAIEKPERNEMASFTRIR
uniref:Putative secreted peptide n=1 Tax=Anopheles braziliensis TaxID=58242 RepID=A0A2M3ZXS3_9DIPT